MASIPVTPVPALRSMTGFGRAEVSGQTMTVSAEARSVNHRHLDIAVRLPRALAAFEVDVRRLIQARLERGRVEVSVQQVPAPGAQTQRVSVDAAGDVTLAWVLERPGVVRLEEAEAPSQEAAWPLLADALGRALDELVGRRTAEGLALAAELHILRSDLRALVDVIAARVPAAVARYQERLRERIKALLDGTAVDEGRILTEVAVWAEKTDVQEELTRLRAHLEQLRLVLDKGGAVGRALDFLIQELNREVNTIASKADDLALSQAALAAKGVIEKLREQVQNLE